MYKRRRKERKPNQKWNPLFLCSPLFPSKIAQNEEKRLSSFLPKPLNRIALGKYTFAPHLIHCFGAILGISGVSLTGLLVVGKESRLWLGSGSHFLPFYACHVRDNWWCWRSHVRDSSLPCSPLLLPLSHERDSLLSEWSHVRDSVRTAPAITLVSRAWSEGVRSDSPRPCILEAFSWVTNVTCWVLGKSRVTPFSHANIGHLRRHERDMLVADKCHVSDSIWAVIRTSFNF